MDMLDKLEEKVMKTIDAIGIDNIINGYGLVSLGYITYLASKILK